MAIAYAIWLGVEKMKIYGCDFSYPNRDYAESGRACVESWITLASIRGMSVQLAPRTSLLDTVKDHGIYGYAEQPEIKLPDGMRFKYVKVNAEATEGKYIGYAPEDSSGKVAEKKPNAAVQGKVPRAKRKSAGNGRTDAVGLGRPAEAPSVSTRVAG